MSDTPVPFDRLTDQARLGLELYAERNKLAFVYYRLDLESLKRLNELVRQLSDADFRLIAAYAEGLASWGQPDSQSGNDPSPQGTPLQGPPGPPTRP